MTPLFSSDHLVTRNPDLLQTFFQKNSWQRGWGRETELSNEQTNTTTFLRDVPEEATHFLLCDQLSKVHLFFLHPDLDSSGSHVTKGTSCHFLCDVTIFLLYANL